MSKPNNKNLDKARKKALKSPRIGKRGKGKKVLEREKKIEDIRQMYIDGVLDKIPELADAQMRLAKGHDYLYKNVCTGKGKYKKCKWEMVTSQNEILQYLNGEFEDSNSDDDEGYYKITTVRPDNRAIDSALDRTIGKPQTNLDITSGGKSMGDILDELE